MAKVNCSICGSGMSANAGSCPSCGLSTDKNSPDSLVVLDLDIVHRAVTEIVRLILRAVLAVLEETP